VFVPETAVRYLRIGDRRLSEKQLQRDTDGQKNVHTTHEDHAVRRSERRITRESVSFDFVHQYEYTEATVVFILWLAFLCLGVAVFLYALPSAYPLEYIVFDVMSAQSNVGLDAGITGPEMPTITKGMLILNMWVGRLEIIPIAVVLGAILGRLDLYRE
jgi:trk system potassium uptake protein TrkH